MIKWHKESFPKLLQALQDGEVWEVQDGSVKDEWGDHHNNLGTQTIVEGSSPVDFDPEKVSSTRTELEVILRCITALD